jgi:hypothetical protein
MAGITTTSGVGPEAQRGNAGHFRERVGGAEGVEHGAQAGVENAVEGKDMDMHGNYDIKIDKSANTATAAPALPCAS